ncbi:OSCP-domain-containing protein [Lepidopterella palustris CBS 459.81]|uniref:ATP synthase subunit 5, mitochondrial n=1 Tax=Lepidopterella palustris CBS 459.81 TaxID=1314670 RepID=A0A8E2EBR1_9PEZI|nr:OSCP-domain-containing protein [Lepidopterella palustris CBS 459.81]
MFPGRAFAQAARSAAPRAPIAPRAAFRCYAQAASPASTKPPIQMFGVDGTYATALYTAAAKTSNLDSASKSIETLAAVFKRDPKLQKVLEAPMLTVEDRKQIVSELQKHIGGADKGDIVKNLLITLADNNRLGVLESVCEKFGVIMGASRGEIEMTVVSAQPLDNKVLGRLESAVSKSQYVGQGKKLKVISKVNPDIRGGLVVEIGDRTIDLSVSSKMSKMSKLLRDSL